jgi:SOS-response transcriptional repressor LexA
MSDFRRRIRERLKTLKKSMRGASLDSGLSAEAIGKILSQPQNSPTLTTIEKLAKGLETTPEWLAFEIAVHRPEHPSIDIRGDVAAGLWLEVHAVDEHALDNIPLTADPRYPASAQYALGVRGTSIDRVARPGDYLLCVDIGMTGIEPHADDIVIVERRRAQSGVREVTAKRIERRGKTIYLHPDSDDPRWQEPIVIDGRKKSDDEEIVIIALVSGVYRPIRRKNGT